MCSHAQATLPQSGVRALLVRRSGASFSQQDFELVSRVYVWNSSICTSECHRSEPLHPMCISMHRCVQLLAVQTSCCSCRHASILSTFERQSVDLTH